MATAAEQEEVARAALRARQGKGARYDAAGAPARELAWARRGAAYFARKLNELSDLALDAPSRLPGWDRRMVVAHVGYQARSLARVAEAARKSRVREELGDPDQGPDDLALGATLPAHALRYLYEHSQAHLNVEWRDLSETDWDARIETLKGHEITPRQSTFERAFAVWIHSVDLGNGGSFRDFPAELIDALVRQRRQALGEARVVMAPDDAGLVSWQRARLLSGRADHDGAPVDALRQIPLWMP
ncbi:maleylpyruvate isomerase N-terminal domain-containing protein [Rhizobium calliandrae]|uniref:Maleylpyruvate isomerase N-terminal domain-containing protein n=1 Tax=Rhizobium calliandrae TaxID=1312182 RepID=A0ABT7KPL6_9HYPH|nr:maleylpyruvate isomerase N-terminal domain-containing protein [Rhizobium calliandrae]MDL2410527.1 maleylpyruvate isomerase N-terminal domain-containing protein [Rhizobium calliandrae]